MRMTLIGRLFVLLALTALGARMSLAATQLSGAKAPDFVLKSVAGPNFRLSEYRGEVVVLTFLAAWCGDCRRQLEALDVLQQRYDDAGLVTLAVSVDPDVRAARSAAETANVGYPVLHDGDGEVGRLYEIASMPSMLLIDRDGVVREVFEGYRRGEERAYVERVRALLRE